MNIGFIGLGLMGESMSLNILKKLDCHLFVYDINPEKVEKLVQAGAIKTNSSFEVAKNSEIIITMVPKTEHVIAVHESLYKAVKPGQLYIDMSTIDPNVSKILATNLKKQKASMIDAPVVKSKSAAIDGTLGIYVGGSKEDYLRALPVLECMGKNIIHLGENGKGASMKLMHNMLVGTIQNGVNEILVLAEKANIDIEDFQKAIAYGGGQNFYLDGKGKSIHQRNFKTAFSVQHMYKDVHLAKDFIDSYHLNLPTTNHIVQIYDEAMNDGYGKEDFSASFKVVEKLSKK